MSTLQQLIGDLNGAAISREDNSGWDGCFIGQVSVSGVSETGGTLRFTLTIPTSPSDINDFIWTTELEGGTTSKVTLTQSGRALDAQVVAIHRIGADARWREQGPDEYRFVFEVPISTEQLRGSEPLRVELWWPDARGPDARLVATASSSSRA
jgi:hypothetical protein